MKIKNLFLTVVLVATSTVAFSQIYTPLGAVGAINPNTGRVGIGTNIPQYKFHVTDVGRTWLGLGGPSTSSGAVADLIFKTFDGGYLNGSMYWDWSFRTDTWAGNVGDFVLYTYSTTNGYTAPIIAQTDGDLALCAGTASQPVKGNVGIGTITPTAKLDVVGDGNFSGNLSIGISNAPAVLNIRGTDHTSHFAYGTDESTYIRPGKIGGNVIMDYGNIGIGTSGPLHKLEIRDSEASSGLGNNTKCAFRINNYYSATYGAKSELQFGIENNSSLATVTAEYTGGGGTNVGGALIFGTSDTDSDQVIERMRITQNGDIGIGTFAPNGYKLAVNGKMIAEEIVVKLYANWPDFVFGEKYDLKPLSEVEAFIEENNHLPNVPSETEVIEQGINLGEMDAILLQKIEELTLYMIALKKENEELRQIVVGK